MLVYLRESPILFTRSVTGRLIFSWIVIHKNLCSWFTCTWKDLTTLSLYGSNCHHKKITKVVFRELTVGQLYYLAKWVSYLTLINSFDITPNLLDLLEFPSDAAHDTVYFELHLGTKTPLTAWQLKLISSAELYMACNLRTEHQATCCFTILMLLAMYCGTDSSAMVSISAPLVIWFSCSSAFAKIIVCLCKFSYWIHLALHKSIKKLKELFQINRVRYFKPFPLK